MPTRDLSWIHKAIINNHEGVVALGLLIIASCIHGSRHGMTDLYHGNHYDVITLPRGANGAAIHGRMFTRSLRSSRDSDDFGCLPISRKVPVEAWFKTPAIVRKRWRSCLKIVCLQTLGKYNNGKLFFYFSQLPTYISHLISSTYVGWSCEKYALLTEIIILSLFFLTIVIPSFFWNVVHFIF